MLIATAKIITIGAALLVIALYLIEWSDNGISESEDVLGLIGFLCALTVNFLALNEKGAKPKIKKSVSEIWPFIVFRRMAIEEKRKIENLERE